MGRAQLIHQLLSAQACPHVFKSCDISPQPHCFTRLLPLGPSPTLTLSSSLLFRNGLTTL